MSEPLLSLRHLITSFETDEGYLRAVDDVSVSYTHLTLPTILLV